MGKKVSVDVIEIYKWLIDVPVGGIVTYSDLSALIGRNVSGRYRYILAAARNMAVRENRIVFDVIKNVGLRRCGNDDMVDVGADGIVRIRNLVDKRAKIILCADYNELSNPKKIKHNATLSLLGAIKQHSTPKAQVEAEKAVAQECQMLPEKELLAQFS